MNLTFDVETSDLPLENPDNKYQFPDPKIRKFYDPCRLVSISWILSRGAEVVQQTYYIIKPKNFIISSKSQKIHGISQEKAESTGIDVSKALNSFNQALVNADNLVAHNVYFDINVIKSEYYRDNQDEKAELIDTKRHICTMKLGKEFMNFHKNPKLSELYHHCYQIRATNLHNAMADTWYCWKCYLKMVPQEPDVYFIKNKKINLSLPQKNIVHADLHKNILVVASAGSGKTLTIAVRIKYLIDSGIDPEKIMLTTFTRDASFEMKSKLFNVLGYESNVKIGTIDSICREFCRNLNLQNVSQFCIEYLDWIKQNPDYLKRWRYLFVDEFQDINQDQFNIINQFYLANVKIFAVGDDCQNIYTFRGSKLDYFLNFNAHFHSIQFQLTDNYRNSSEIINFGNQIIQSIDQIPKTMTATHLTISEKKLPQIYLFHNIRDQSDKILEKITRDFSSPKNEIAILAPQNYHLFFIEEKLAKYGINSILLDKIPKDQIHRSDSIHLSTIHKAKGLEWNHVILIGADDHIFPKQKDDRSIKEGRRLFYVAITRARISLDIMSCQHPQGPTRYLAEIPRKFWHSENDIYFPKSSDYIGEKKNKSIQAEKAISVFNNCQWNNVIHLTNNLQSQFHEYKWKISKNDISHDFHPQFTIFFKALLLRELFNDKITPSEICFSTISDLGHDLKRKYLDSAKKYSNHSLKWTDIVNDIWNISALKHVFTDKRRKLLYYKPDDFLANVVNSGWADEIIENIKLYHGEIISKNHHHHTLQYQFSHDDSLFKLWDHIDIISDKSLIMLKADYSIESRPKLEWITQLITQKILCDINLIPIEHLIIINILNHRSWVLKSDSISQFNHKQWLSIFFVS